MNTRTILLSLCLVAGTAAMAQGTTQTTTPQATVDRAQAHHDALVKELGLTPEQDQKLLAIEERHRQSAKELNRANLDTPARQERARILRDNKDKEIQGILTAEQYQKYLDMRKQKRSDGVERVKEVKTHQE